MDWGLENACDRAIAALQYSRTLSDIRVACFSLCSYVNAMSRRRARGSMADIEATSQRIQLWAENGASLNDLRLVLRVGVQRIRIMASI
jgi:hypothetical protein